MTVSDTSLGQNSAVRWVVAVLFSLLAFIGAVGSVVGYWAHNVLFDTETWVETVGPIGTDPVVTDALSEYATGEITEFLDPTARLTEFFPDALAPLAEVIGAAVEQAIAEETAEFFTSDRYAELWNGLNQTAHTAVVAIIRDQVPFLSTAEGVVSVDLVPVVTPIVDRVIVRARQIGDSLPDILLGAVDFDDALAEIIAEYERDGPPERLSNVVIYESDRLAAVQHSAALFDRLVVVFPILTVLLAVGAVVIAPGRRWMIPVLLVGAALAWWLSMLLADFLIVRLVEGVASGDAADVAEALLQAVTARLDGLLTTLLFTALLAGGVAAGWMLLYRPGQPEESGSYSKM